MNDLAFSNYTALRILGLDHLCWAAEQAVAALVGSARK
jgi:hypothetical protein